MTIDRFDYESNLARATRYHGWRGALWPPSDEHRVHCLDLADAVPDHGPDFFAELDSLRAGIEAEWQHAKLRGGDGKGPLRDAASLAETMRRLAAYLPSPDDQRALQLRASALEHGYDDETLARLATLEEHVTLVAGRLSTWYGKQRGGLPAAFGCVRDARAQAAVEASNARLPDLAAHVRSLHSQLRLGRVPAFAATALFFMAGEGNKHPKHIAYFLPEDEGVKRSPFKKTYYFGNTHRALIEAGSLPLVRELLDLGVPVPARATELDPLPTLGVLAHEAGHFVFREGTSFAALNAADRWASVTLQEMAADVFGTLMLAEVLAPALEIDPARVVLYHLGECLRYVDRGLGCFPDSDGMYLQLEYLASFGALRVDPASEPLLTSDPEVVIAGFRSLARVLADTLLAGDTGRSLALHRSYGPAGGRGLAPLIERLRRAAPKTIEYRQEPLAMHAAAGPDRGRAPHEEAPHERLHP